MDKLPYLNLGCGSHFDPDWVNVDFSVTGKGVIAYNLLQGVPFNTDEFEVVYHSHVLEHFQKPDAVKFIAECYRVLKQGGVLRIAIPDLEQIANNYINLLARGKADPDNEKIRADYTWTLIEMYDQTVRNTGGGEMLKFLADKEMLNEDFMLQRIGHEGAMLRKSILAPKADVQKRPAYRRLLSRVKQIISPKNYKEALLKALLKDEYSTLELGRFRQCGEIHQWMYDIYSIGHLLKQAGFKDIKQMTFDTSSISNWRSFKLDEVDGVVRKPDSLFVEATK